MSQSILSGDELPGFAQRLKEARKQLGLEQAHLAGRAGLSVRMICSYEAGVSGPRRETAERLAVAVEKPVDWLLFGGESQRLSARRDQQEVGVDRSEHRAHIETDLRSCGSSRLFLCSLA